VAVVVCGSGDVACKCLGQRVLSVESKLELQWHSGLVYL
jgi:hypothetical protein